MKKWIPLVGICLILLSLALLLTFQLRLQTDTAHNGKILEKMEILLPERIPAGIHTGEAMPVLEIDGKDYAALLEIPAFGLELPIADRWESGKLSRFSGSAYDNTLVIGGPDHPKQFGFCDQIDLGVPITLTDMTGGQFFYTVARVDRSKHADAEWLQNPAYDLTLFCRDTVSMDYIAVRCQAK